MLGVVTSHPPNRPACCRPLGVAVNMPTTFHIWMLISATAASFIFFGILSGLEFKLAKRALKEAVHRPGKE